MTSNAFLQYICNHLCRDEPSSSFVILQHQVGTHIRQILQYQFPSAHIRIADKDYSAPTKQEFEAWLKSDPVNEMVYRSEWLDCDDFARTLRCAIFKVGHALKTTITLAYCEGSAPGGYHAFNLLIDDQDAMYIIEPQNDSVIPANESTYLPDFIQI